MKITILGAGVGGSHYLNNRGMNQYPPAFLVEWGAKEKILFDCSQGVQNRLEKMGYDYANIHFVAISHSHPDHCAPIHFIQSVYLKGLWNSKFKNNKLTFFGPDHLINNFMTLWNIYNPNLKDKFLEWPKIKLVPMSLASESFSIGDGKLSAKKVYHAFGNCDAVSYRLETPEGVIAYSGDTGDCGGVRTVAKDADLFICEASAKVGDTKSKKEYGHLDPYTVGEIAKDANVKKVLLFHYTGHDSDKKMISEVKRAGFTEEIIAGKDFQVINI